MIKHCKIPILNSEYYVIAMWGDNVKEAYKLALRWLDVENAKHFLDESCRGKWVGQSGTHPVIWINTKTNDKHHFYATVTHEAVHAICGIWEMIGETDYTSEIFAHCVAAVVAGVEKVKARR